jgi:hypothetical protein
MLKATAAATACALALATPSMAQDNQYFAEMITDCSLLAVADRNAPFSEPMPLSELRATPMYPQMVNGMTETLDALDLARDKEGTILHIEQMLGGMPDGDIALECFRVALDFKEGLQ